MRAGAGRERGGLAPQHQRQRQHRGDTEQADADMGLPPAEILNGVLDDRRPDRASDIVARCTDRHRDAAPAGEPHRRIGHQRPERGRAAEQRNQHALGQGVLPQGLRIPGGHVADAEHDSAEHDRGDHAETVGEAAHQHAASGKAEHRQGERQRGGAAIDGELHLRRGQRNHDRPHTNPAQRAQQHRGSQAQPGISRVDAVLSGGGISCGRHGDVLRASRRGFPRASLWSG